MPVSFGRLYYIAYIKSSLYTYLVYYIGYYKGHIVSDFKKVTGNFSVPDLNAICIERCETATLECLIDCENDLGCVSDCLRGQTQCNQGWSEVIHSFF